MSKRVALISVYGTGAPEKELYNSTLYNLLAERKPYMNISHNGKLPTYQNHVRFVESKPYKEWFLIQDLDTNSFIGSIYLGKDDNVGIFLFEKYWHKGYGTLALDILMEYCKEVPKINANISPANSASLCFFLNRGFKLESATFKEDLEEVLQYTYTTANPYYVA